MFKLALTLYLCATTLTTQILFVPHISDDSLELMNYAWNISGGDMDFILTVYQESKRDHTAIGDAGASKGLCQRHMRYQPETRNDPEFGNKRWQVHKCLQDYNKRVAEGIITTQLYGYNVRFTNAHLFKHIDVGIEDWWKFNHEFVKLNEFENHNDHDWLDETPLIRGPNLETLTCSTHVHETTEAYRTITPH